VATNPSIPAWRRALGILNPAREHTARSATILVMAAIASSRGVGFLRESYIAWAFGAGREAAAYIAAFTLPNILVYMLAGGSVSTTFITIYSRTLVSGKREEGDHTFSVIVTVVSLVLAALVVIAEVFAKPLTALLFSGMDAQELALTTSMTRILLPMELCMYIGSVVQGVLYSRKLFLIPAVTPIIFNLAIIGGGVALSPLIGVHSLAVGALTGAAIGPLALASVVAVRAGLRYRPTLDHKDPAFREWVALTLPLMIGVSLVSADDWIMRSIASADTGAIAHLNYSKRLFGVPSALLNQAIGLASLPFFARLFAEKRLAEFGKLVNDSVSRSVGAAILLSSLMIAAALPAVDLVYRRGHFSFDDSLAVASYFLVFSIALAFWPAQGLYSRAFYSANDTLTPMVATTLITLASIPVYALLYRHDGPRGLSIASDVGIGMNTIVLALLLHRRKHVRLGGLAWGEIGKALAASVAAGIAAMRIQNVIPVTGGRLADIESLAAVGAVWLAVVWLVLTLLRSELPRQLIRRKRPAAP
jgi:putative peptidoglycan lipid II flippase